MLKQINNNNVKNGYISYIKYSIIFFVHLVGALFLALFLLFLLSYLGLLGEFSSKGIFFLWQAAGSYILSVLILILSIFVVTLSNPVYALICLIIIFFSAAVSLLALNVNFLAMIYLIIYIGAIAILFLFVIMMFNLRELTQQSTQFQDLFSLYVSLISYFLVLSKFYALILNYTTTYIEYDKYFNEFINQKANSLQYFLTYQHTDTLLFGTLLYEYYSYLFILAALILLTAMLGSIILALSTTEKTAR